MSLPIGHICQKVTFKSFGFSCGNPTIIMHSVDNLGDRAWLARLSLNLAKHFVMTWYIKMLNDITIETKKIQMCSRTVQPELVDWPLIYCSHNA